MLIIILFKNIREKKEEKKIIKNKTQIKQIHFRILMNKIILKNNHLNKLKKIKNISTFNLFKRFFLCI